MAKSYKANDVKRLQIMTWNHFPLSVICLESSVQRSWTKSFGIIWRLFTFNSCTKLDKPTWTMVCFYKKKNSYSKKMRFCSKSSLLDLYRIKIKNDQELQPFTTNLWLSLNCVGQKVPQHQCKCLNSFWMFRYHLDSI